MKSKYFSRKSEVIMLRKSGKTYGEIIKIIGKSIPKSTLSDWCRDIYLTNGQKDKIDKLILENSKKGLAVAWIISKKRREDYLKLIFNKNKDLPLLLKNKKIAKITLATLYMCEGTKGNRGSLILGNSSPDIIRLFLNLLRFCYTIDESKFRCTVQCRADQKTELLEKFWSKVTKIPPSQFYKPQIDSRTIGKPTKKLNYMGVCRIDYFSGKLFAELIEISNILYQSVK